MRFVAGFLWGVVLSAVAILLGYALGEPLHSLGFWASFDPAKKHAVLVGLAQGLGVAGTYAFAFWLGLYFTSQSTPGNRLARLGMTIGAAPGAFVGAVTLLFLLSFSKGPA